MVKNHLKSMAIPRAWPTARKDATYSAKPQAGKQRELSLALITVVRDLVGACATAKECQNMLNAGLIEVSGKQVKSLRYPVGVFDIVTLTKSKKSYRLVVNKVGKLQIVECKQNDPLIGRVAGKTSAKKGTQINLYNGRCIIVEKDDYKVGDSIVFEAKDKVAIKKKLEFKKGATAMLMSGKHRGAVGQVVDIQGKIIIFNDGEKDFETKRSFAYVLGDKESLITVQ